MNVIGVSSDENYFQYAKILINSAARYNPTTAISYRAINFKPDYTFPALVKVCNVHANTSSKKTFLMKGVDIEHPRMQNLRSRLLSKQTLYAAHDKYTHAINLLNEGYDRVLITDADNIIRSSIKEMFGLLDDCELIMMMHHCSNVFIKDKILSEGIILCKNCSSVKSFLKSVTAKIHEISLTKNYDIDTDTEVVADIFSKSNIVFRELDTKYKDADLNNDSIIWSGQGIAKTTLKFKREMQLYEN